MVVTDAQRKPVARESEMNGEERRSSSSSSSSRTWLTLEEGPKYCWFSSFVKRVSKRERESECEKTDRKRDASTSGPCGLRGRRRRRAARSSAGKRAVTNRKSD